MSGGHPLTARQAGLLFKWHVVMPALTAVFGYFPGSRLGWLEDTPKGVVRDWIARHPRFEDNWRRGTATLPQAERDELVRRFAAVRADTLALSVSDDEFGTTSAIQRLLGYFTGSRCTHWRIAPVDIGEQDVGHFAFFRSHYQDRLWPIALHWLQHGTLAAGTPGHPVPPAVI